ncbi:hypothetical protein [Paractinoplanes toevensis]|nr:hypothetical protein [Actinoplanes toevensis]
MIGTRDGGVFGGMVPAGSAAHMEVLSWQEQLARWQVSHPDERLPFGTHRIRVGDVDSIVIGERR